jgi:hypothetical protein
MVGGTCFVVVGIVRICKKEIDTMETIMVELSPEISLHALRTDTTLVMISQSINQSLPPSLTQFLQLCWSFLGFGTWLFLTEVVYGVCVCVSVYMFLLPVWAWIKWAFSYLVHTSPHFSLAWIASQSEITLNSLQSSMTSWVCRHWNKHHGNH